MPDSRSDFPLEKQRTEGDLRRGNFCRVPHRAPDLGTRGFGDNSQFPIPNSQFPILS
ncbi:MAG: hypothetical protein F6J93_21335 [Oscillatoria sp. SIO1A7]|nr:hypothetical protein [Oscillatoria sp. SIO1A7]